MKLFMHFLESQNIKLGIENNNSIINIRGFAKKIKARYKASKSVFAKIIHWDKVIKDWRFSRIRCRSLNEGITELLKQKVVEGYETYFKEVNVVKQIENIVGIESIIDVANKHPERMKELLNMNSKEYDSFCSQMDYIAFLDDLQTKIEKNLYEQKKYDEVIEFNEKEGKYLNNERILTTADVQIKLLQKLIIPYFESNKEINDELFEKALQCVQLMKSYCIFVESYENAMDIMEETKEFKKLKGLLDIVIVQYTAQNIDAIDTWNKEKIFAVEEKLFKYGSIHSDNFGDKYELYTKFKEKLSDKIQEIRSNEDKKILDEVRQKINGKEKIDISLLIKDCGNKYTSYDIMYKVRELILNRKLTYAQQKDLTSELLVYQDCGKVISKKEIKKTKNEDGKTEYYVISNGEKITGYALKKMKQGRKFLSSKKYEYVEAEKEEAISPKEALVCVNNEEGGKGRFRRFIAKIKKIFAKKEIKAADEKIEIPETDFKKELRVDVNKTSFNIQAQQQKRTKTINLNEKERE